MARRGAGALALLLGLGIGPHGGRSSPSNKESMCPGSNTSDPGHAALFNCSSFGPANGFYPLPKSARHPVMFVPSMIGSYLERKLHNSDPVYPICANGGWMGGSSWYRMWPPAGLNLAASRGSGITGALACLLDMSCLPTDLFPLYADCWGDDLTTVFDKATGLSHPKPGVQIRANGSLGIVADNSSAIPEYVCASKVLQAAGYQAYAEYDSLGYDWRLAPADWSAPGGYYEGLKTKIEGLRQRNGKPVVLVSLSLGGPVTAVFLNRYVDQAWKDQNIYNWLSTSGTFGGVQESLLQQITFNGSTTVSMPSHDDSPGRQLMTPEYSLKTFQGWPSQNWMAATLAPNDVVVNVTGSSVEYRGKDIGNLFDVIKNPNHLKEQAVKNALSPSTTAPGVETYIFTGSGHGTPRTFEFAATADGRPNLGLDSPAPKPHCVDGDGVATASSLSGVPQRWAAQGLQRGKKVEITILANVSHGGDIAQPQVLRKLYEIIQ